MENKYVLTYAIIVHMQNNVNFVFSSLNFANTTQWK